MISNLKTFENKNFGKLTVIEKDGEFFFIANEVATMLGYVNPDSLIIEIFCIPPGVFHFVTPLSSSSTWS